MGHPVRRRRALFELLEDRRLLAVCSQVLGAENDVVLAGDTGFDTVQLSVVDGFLQHNLGGRPGFTSNRDWDSTIAGEQDLLLSEIGSLSFADTGNNDRVLFSGSSAFDFAAADLSFNVGEITVSPGVSLSTTDGVIDLFATETILIDRGASLSTVDGGIRLTANSDGSTTGDRYSVHLLGASLTTSGAGAIQIEGTGAFSKSGYNAGAGIELGSTIQSTGTQPTAGGISIHGIGKQGVGSTHHSSSWGVHTRDAGTSITSAYGDISIIGRGGNASTLNSLTSTP